MQIEILKSKIHRASVTAASLNYEGSLSIDASLMEQAGFYPYVKILCSNLANQLFVDAFEDDRVVGVTRCEEHFQARARSGSFGEGWRSTHDHELHNG